MIDLSNIHNTDFLGMIMETDDNVDVITLDIENGVAKYWSTINDEEIERMMNDE